MRLLDTLVDYVYYAIIVLIVSLLLAQVLPN
jgi:hypothetical protein